MNSLGTIIAASLRPKALAEYVLFQGLLCLVFLLESFYCQLTLYVFLSFGQDRSPTVRKIYGVNFVDSEMATFFVKGNKESSEFLKQSTKFMTNLYKKIALRSGDTENVVISPFSLQSILALVYMGVEGAAADEIAEVLHMNKMDRPATSLIFKEILDFLKVRRIVKIFNALLVNEGSIINEHYKSLAKKAFHADIRYIDILSGGAVSHINTWVAEETKNIITELVSPESLRENNRILLINAVHFKSTWQTPFMQKHTKENDFWISNYSAIRVRMMSLTSDLNYREFKDLDATAIELPYKNCIQAMVIILPNQRDGLRNLENKITDNLVHIACKLRRTRVNVKIPKFKTQFDINLDKVIASMGVRSVFMHGADFSLMLDPCAKTNVTGLLHKVIFEVDDDDTAPASATSVPFTKCAAQLSDTTEAVEFVADHPFLFYVWDKKTILFFGRISSPST